MKWKNLLLDQRQSFKSGATRSVSYRLMLLKKLYRVVESNEQKIQKALYEDFKKPGAESYVSEIGIVLKDIQESLTNLNKWSKPRRKSVPLLAMVGFGKVYPEPYGQVLILSPWNYPFQLAISPLVGAIAAGNVAVLKPSEHSPHTSRLLDDLISENFDPNDIFVIQGDGEVATELLNHPFDYIFFTGSPKIGRQVMLKAAQHLTPVTLELGGKSPCIVDASADLKIAARRIVWGKFFNGGQTCISPDYLLVHKSVATAFKTELKNVIDQFYSDVPEGSGDLARIINQKHYLRLKNYLNQGEILIGGETNDNDHFIAPTVLINVSPDTELFNEEIFGPLLPLFEYESTSEIVDWTDKFPKPLALYLFTRNEKVKDFVIQNIQFGGGCINDTLLHFTCPQLPFGGIGSSGMGRYHGEYSFKTFSHFKGVLHKSNWPDPQFRYPPYKGKIPILKKFF